MFHVKLTSHGLILMDQEIDDPMDGSGLTGENTPEDVLNWLIEQDLIRELTGNDYDQLTVSIKRV